MDMLIYHSVLALSFFISFVTFVYVTRGRRPISNILAWLFFIFLLPFVGIPLFFLFGERKLEWVINKKRSMYQRSIDPKSSKDPLQKIIDISGVLPPTHNNQTRLLTSGEESYHVLIQYIRQAQHSILISTYVLGNDDVADTIIQELALRAHHGVQICLLLDTVGSLFKYPRRKLNALKKAGGSARFIMPLLHLPLRGSTNLRDHRKIMIFDRHTAMIGGMNLAEEYMGPTPDPKRWCDLNMVIQGDAVNDLVSVFESDWEFAGSMLKDKRYQRMEGKENNPVGNTTLQILASGPDTIGDRLYDAIISAIYNAKKNIHIVTPYFILDDGLQKAFIIAVRRGVDVNIIIPHCSNHPMTDLVRAISVRKLRSEGAKIWYYPDMLHAKAMKFDDDLAIIGSANLDIRSLLLNFEISCFISSAEDVKNLETWMMSIQQRCSLDFKKPTFFKMLLEDAAQLIKPLL